MVKAPMPANPPRDLILSPMALETVRNLFGLHCIYLRQLRKLHNGQSQFIMITTYVGKEPIYRV